MNQLVQMMMIAMMVRTGKVMLQSMNAEDSAMMRSSAMAAIKTLDSQLNKAVPEMDTAANDAQTILDLYGDYLTSKDKVSLLDFINSAKNASMYGHYAKGVTKKYVTKGIIYPRDISDNGGK